MHGRQLHICRYAIHVGCGFLCPGVHGSPTLICPILLGAPEKDHRPPLPPINSSWDVTGEEVSVICSIF